MLNKMEEEVEDLDGMETVQGLEEIIERWVGHVFSCSCFMSKGHPHDFDNLSSF